MMNGEGDGSGCFIVHGESNGEFGNGSIYLGCDCACRSR